MRVKLDISSKKMELIDIFFSKIFGWEKRLKILGDAETNGNKKLKLKRQQKKNLFSEKMEE